MVLVPDVAGHESSPRTWKWGMLATLGFLAAVTLGTLVIRVRARQSQGAQAPWSAAFAADDAAIPDDTVLREQLQKAIDLRRREFFDRVLEIFWASEGHRRASPGGFAVVAMPRLGSARAPGGRSPLGRDSRHSPIAG